MAYITYQSIMKIAETEPNLKKTFQGIAHQVAYTAGGTAIGGVLAGPVGAVIGSLAGTVVGYYTVKDYNSLIVVLHNMSDADKKRLVKEVELLIGSSLQEVLLTFVKSEANCRLLIDIFKKFAQ